MTSNEAKTRPSRRQSTRRWPLCIGLGIFSLKVEINTITATATATATATDACFTRVSGVEEAAQSMRLQLKLLSLGEKHYLESTGYKS
jgi:hypothetical protein